MVTRDGTDVTDDKFTGLKRILLSLGVDKNAVNNCGSRAQLKTLGLLHQVLVQEEPAAEPNRVVDPAQLQMAAQMMNQRWTVSNAAADDASTASQLRALDAEIAAQSALNNSRQVLPSLHEPQGHPWEAALSEILEPASAASTHQLLFDFTPVRNQEVQSPAEVPVNRSGDTTLVRTYTAGGTDRTDEATKYMWYVLCCCQAKGNQAAAG